MRTALVRALSLACLLLLVSTSTLAQSKFDGKWATERKQGPQGPAQLELTANATAVKGTLSLGGLGGEFYTFDQGKLAGSRIYFRVLVGPSTYSTWHAEFVNDNTIILWSWGLELVGDNVLDLLKALPGVSLAPAAPAATPLQTAQSAQVTTATPGATAADPPPSCSDKTGARCYVLHRTK
jgi:hypothetical protein